MYSLDINRRNRLSPPLYKGSLGARQTELTIFVFANGDEFNCNQAMRFNLCKFDLLAWNPTLDTIASRMGLQKKGIKSLYTRCGKRINGHWELSNGGCYVGVGWHERFRKLNYSDPKCEQFQRCADRQALCAFKMETAPFYCSTSVKILPTVHNTQKQHCITSGGTQVPRFTKQTHSPSKISKSLEEIRRIYSKSNIRRSRRVPTLSVPYYQKVNPFGNIRKTCKVRSTSVNLPSESTRSKIIKFTSKYLPYYTKLQNDFLKQRQVKVVNPSKICQKKLSPTDKSDVLKSVHMDSSATNILCSRCSGPIVSDTSQVTQANNPSTNSFPRTSYNFLSKKSDVKHTISPETDIPAPSFSYRLHTNTSSTKTPHSHYTLLRRSYRVIHANTPESKVSLPSTNSLLSKTSGTLHTNTPVSNESPNTSSIRIYTNTHLQSSSSLIHKTTSSTKQSSHSSYTLLSESSRVIQTNTLSNTFVQSSAKLSPKCSRTDRTNAPSHNSSTLSPGKSPTATLHESALTCVPILNPDQEDGTTNQLKIVSSFLNSIVDNETLSPRKSLHESARTCVPTLKRDREDKATNQLRSVSSFLNSNVDNETLAEWEAFLVDDGETSERDLDKAMTDSNEEKPGECRSPVTSKDLCNDRPSTARTEYPEETEDTLVDYWFMSELEYEDDSSDDLEEGGLKMTFLQLD